MVNFKTVELDRKIIDLVTKHEQELKILKIDREIAEKLEPEMILAEQLHKRFCYHNHADQCGFLYGSWEKPRHEQREWLSKAIRFIRIAELREISPEVFLELVDMVKL